MQAVILAAGRGTRMGVLTKDSPKALLQVAGKTLLEYALEALPDEITEVIIVVGYFGAMLQARFGGAYKEKRLLYVEQDDLATGTAGALWCAKEILHDRFLVMMADDLYCREDAKRCISAKDWALLVQKVPRMGEKGSVETDPKGNILKITEGNHGGREGLISTNMFLLDTRIFRTEPVPKAAGSGEWGLPQTAVAAAHSQNISFQAIPATFWTPISAPDDLKKAEEILKKLDR